MGEQVCKCGWQVPQGDTVIVTLRNETASPVACVEAIIEMCCPVCGEGFRLNDFKLYVEN